MQIQTTTTDATHQTHLLQLKGQKTPSAIEDVEKLEPVRRTAGWNTDWQFLTRGRKHKQTNNSTPRSAPRRKEAHVHSSVTHRNKKSKHKRCQAVQDTQNKVNLQDALRLSHAKEQILEYTQHMDEPPNHIR